MFRYIALFLSLCVHTVEAIELDKLDTDTLQGKKIGYYIGSFDPLHLGHEAVVSTVLDQQLCDYVLIYPAWGGDIYKNRTDVAIRLEMLFSTFKNHPQVIVTTMAPGDLQNALTQDDLDRTISGKPVVKSKISGVEFIGIIGSDTAIETVSDQKKLSVFMRGVKIDEKYKAHTIGGVIGLPATSFIVSLRQGDSLVSLGGTIGDRPIIKEIVTSYPASSSTEIRTLLQSGAPVDHLVNKQVFDIVHKQMLYN